MRRTLLTLATFLFATLSLGALLAWTTDFQYAILLRDGHGTHLTCLLVWHHGFTGLIWTHAALPFENQFLLPDWILGFASALLILPAWLLRPSTAPAAAPAGFWPSRAYTLPTRATPARSAF